MNKIPDKEKPPSLMKFALLCTQTSGSFKKISFISHHLHSHYWHA